MTAAAARPTSEDETYEKGADDRPARLHGELVVLRPLRVDDVERVAEIQSRPGVLSWWGQPNEAELRRQAEGRNEAKALAIECNGELVGLIQYEEENEPDFRHAGIDVLRIGGRRNAQPERGEESELAPHAWYTVAVAEGVRITARFPSTETGEGR